MADQRDDYRVDRASVTGGLVFDDPKEGEMLRRSLQYLVQRVSGQVMAGNMNFTRMAMPIHLNEPRSLLERITDDWAYATHYLPAAAASTDPVERIKLVAAFVVSGLHCVHTLGKPFNPILGSTYRANLPDGTPCYVEQTSHHPPVTHYLIQPESGAYTFAGFSGIDGRIAFGLDTGLSSRRIGVNVVQFVDGSRIAYNLPRMIVRGLAAERKCEYQGPFSVFDEDNGLVFDFLIDPPQPFRWSPFRARTPSDYLDGVLYHISPDEKGDNAVAFSGAFKQLPDAFFGNPDGAKKVAEEEGYTPVELRSDNAVAQSVISAIRARDIKNQQVSSFGGEIISYARGTFLGYLDVGDERLWDIRVTPKAEPIPSELKSCLGSDCRRREDVLALKKALNEENDDETRDALTNEAQLLKEQLENIQRNDRKLRMEGLSQEAGSDTSGASSAESSNSVVSGTESVAQKSVDREQQHPENERATQQEQSSQLEHKEAPFFPKSLGGL